MERSEKSSHTRSLAIMITIIIVVLAAWGWYYTNFISNSNDTDDHESTQTVITDNDTDREYTSYTSTKGEDVRLVTPNEDDTIISPLEVEGEVPEGWALEDVFQIEIRDQANQPVAEAFAEVETDSRDTMQPFQGELEFGQRPSGATGTLILRQANPSGLAEDDDEVELRIRF